MSEDLIYVRERSLPYPTFDADNHMYENRDALTKFIPKEHEGIVKYVDINGRTKLALRDQISDYIPNPTFEKVAVPGGYGRSHVKSELGPGDRPKPRVMPGLDAFFDPEPRLALMKDMGIDRALMWPTLASVLEERLADDPDVTCMIIHALNEWMYEHWTFNYADAIYPTPIISLSRMDKAIEELQLVVERGARIFLLRVAPVPTYTGRKSFALPEFDPFWELVTELDVVVGMHAGDPGYQRYINEWEGSAGREFSAFKRTATPAFLSLMSEKSAVVDAMASIIGHELATRFPTLRFAPVEFPYEWIRPFVHKLQDRYERTPMIFEEDPYEVFKRNVWVHAFHDPDPAGLLELLPADHVMWGSDFPHPEGLGDPLGYSEALADLPQDTQALIMGGSLATMMKIPV